MKALFIGGTGTISSAVSRLAAERGWDLWLLNRGRSSERVPEEAHTIQADISDEAAVSERIGGMRFDVVADFIAFTPSQVERDIRLFSGRTGQYIFISSASAYQKPLNNYRITESTPLRNPYWKYAQDKIACEERLTAEYRANGFPVTIVRPSYTYDERRVPVALKGSRGSWQVIDRIRAGKPVLIPGDGTSLWVMTHNSDFAQGFVGIMGHPRAIGESFHITSDEVLSWDQIYDSIGRAFGARTVKYHVPSDFIAACRPEMGAELFGDKASSVSFDNRKIKRLIPDFAAAVRFEEGIRRTADYILRHPELQVPDEEFDRFCDRVIAAQENALRFFRDADVSRP